MLRRGEIYRVRHPEGDPRRARAFLVVSRSDFLAIRYSTAACVPIYSMGGLSRAELPLGPGEGLKHPSFARCDEVTSVPRRALTDFVGSLSKSREAELSRALAIALDIEPEDLAGL